MKSIKKAINFLAIICYAAVGFFAVLELPFLAGYRPEAVLSGSMEPFYPVGSIIYCKKVSFEEIKTGDAITFNSGNSVVTHRVVKINSQNKTFLTKGDANQSADGFFVNFGDVRGKAEPFAVPYAGYAAMFFLKNLWILIFMAVIFILKIFIK